MLKIILWIILKQNVKLISLTDSRQNSCLSKLIKILYLKNRLFSKLK